MFILAQYVVCDFPLKSILHFRLFHEAENCKSLLFSVALLVDFTKEVWGNPNKHTAWYCQFIGNKFPNISFLST